MAAPLHEEREIMILFIKSRDYGAQSPESGVLNSGLAIGDPEIPSTYLHRNYLIDLVYLVPVCCWGKMVVKIPEGQHPQDPNSER